MSDLGVAGFRFAGIHCGIKKRGGLDLGLVVADELCACAGVFTQNKVVAAPVVQSKARLSGRNLARVIVINSGNANACTGVQGEADALRMAEVTAEAIGCSSDDVQVCSTGVIGAPLPMNILDEGIVQAAQMTRADGLRDFAKSICTTDTFEKVRSLTRVIGEREVTVAGVSKGAGMIHPNMATMLGVVVTDAVIAPATLDELWRSVCQRTFNAITVDGDTSTNDAALIMASGRAGGQSLAGDELRAFESLLTDVAGELAKDIVRDAEGGTKVVAIAVDGARSYEDACLVADAVSLSPLVKTAMHGEDPNWGRIVAAAGRSGASLDPERLSLRMDDVMLYENGAWLGADAETAARQVMLRDEYVIRITLGDGPASRTVYTCDFSADYVRINADYRS